MRYLVLFEVDQHTLIYCHCFQKLLNLLPFVSGLLQAAGTSARDEISVDLLLLRVTALGVLQQHFEPVIEVALACIFEPEQIAPHCLPEYFAIYHQNYDLALVSSCCCKTQYRSASMLPCLSSLQTYRLRTKSDA